MKISKLFHWLYATLMFLPILMFLPSCLYYGFNHEAQAQEETREVPVYYDTNEVESLDDLVYGNIYTLNNFSSNMANDFRISIDFYNVVTASSITYQTTTDDDCIWASSNSYLRLVDNSLTDNTMVFTSTGITIDFVLTNILRSTNLLSYVTACPRQYVKEYQPVTYTLSISDSINYAWERTWNLPVFAWTQNSFVTAPFSYITGLFGLSSDNSLNYVFTYFASISICWLVFDLLMYVPNLTHRWLDKGAIE